MPSRATWASNSVGQQAEGIEVRQKSNLRETVNLNKSIFVSRNKGIINVWVIYIWPLEKKF